MPTLIDLSHTIFDGLITYKTYPRRCNLKEAKNTLRLSIEGLFSIDQAVNLLSEVAEPVGV